MINKLKKQKGIGIIEVIISVSIIIIAFGSFVEIAKYSLRIQEENSAKVEALNLSFESIEAMRSIRDETWNNISSLVIETEYYPIILENKWALTLINPGLINEKYNRFITIEKVYRDLNDNISESGSEDSQTIKINSIVEWNNRGKTKQINLSTYLTNWNN